MPDAAFGWCGMHGYHVRMLCPKCPTSAAPAPMLGAGTGPMKVTLDSSLWAQIVFRVRASEDEYLRQLVEQAVAGGQMSG